MSVYCADCDETKVVSNNQNLPNILLCSVCGSNLNYEALSNTSATSSNIQLLDNDQTILRNLSEIWGIDLMMEIENERLNSSPMRSVSSSFVESLGKVNVDNRKSILYNVNLQYGPLSINAVSSSFGLIPNTVTKMVGPIMYGIPSYGESKLIDPNSYQNSFLILKRGSVSFATKALRALESKAAVLIVEQTLDVWPFVMSDSGKELESNGVNAPVTIPVVMINAKDADLLRKVYNQLLTSNPLIRDSSNKDVASLTIGNATNECSICQEVYEVDAEVVKLPCCHVYHTVCALTWLSQHNTCPLCRHEMPAESKAKRDERNNPVRLPSYYT